MTTELPRPGDPFYCESVDAWITVELVPREEMENPPRQALYDEWYEQLDAYKDNKVIRTEGGIPKCTCRPKADKHASDCRIHPHRMVILADSKVLQKTKKDEFAVESLFLRPTSWDEELLEMILSDVEDGDEKEKEIRPEKPSLSQESSSETELADGAEKQGMASAPEAELSRDVTASASEGDMRIEEVETENLPVTSFSEFEELVKILKGSEKKYALIILKDGVLTVEDALNSNDPELALTEEIGKWKYKGEAIGDGEVLYFANDRCKDFVSIIEADPSQLKMLAVAAEFSFKAIFRDLKILKF